MADDLNAQTRLEKITAIRHKLIQKKQRGILFLHSMILLGF
jgi:Xaa-Pro aminopeptidase